jgi:ribosomal protein L34E
MPRNDRCHVCNMPAETVVNREPYRAMCSPCYRHLRSRKEIREAIAFELDEAAAEAQRPERPLSSEEMVAELLEMREDLS